MLPAQLGPERLDALRARQVDKREARAQDGARRVGARLLEQQLQHAVRARGASVHLGATHRAPAQRLAHQPVRAVGRVDGHLGEPADEDVAGGVVLLDLQLERVLVLRQQQVGQRLVVDLEERHADREDAIGQLLDPFEAPPQRARDHALVGGGAGRARLAGADRAASGSAAVRGLLGENGRL